MDDDEAFSIVEKQATKANPVPIPRKQGGFSRQDVANAFQHAFTMIGGVQRLALWAHANPDKFYPLYSKLLPAQAVILGDIGVQRILHAIPRTALDEHPPTDGANAIHEIEFVPAPTEDDDLG